MEVIMKQQHKFSLGYYMFVFLTIAAKREDRCPGYSKNPRFSGIVGSNRWRGENSIGPCSAV